MALHVNDGMEKPKLCRALALLALLAAALPLAGQDERPASTPELMTRHFADSYDSLLNSHYMHRFKHLRHHRASEFSLDDFDRLPDSLLIERLQRLHTVLPMTFNSDVRSHIRFYLRVMERRLEVFRTSQRHVL